MNNMTKLYLFTSNCDSISIFGRWETLLETEMLHTYINQPNFFRLSISHSEKTDWCLEVSNLMVEFDNGNEWWCVGKFDNSYSIPDLPKWNYKEKK